LIRESPLKISQRKLLLVEGKEDERFFAALIEHLCLVQIQVIPFGGKPKLGPFLRALVMDSSFDAVESIGIVRDSDTSPDSAFQSVSTALAQCKLPAPSTTLEAVGDKPHVAVMILPDMDSSGSLEDICLRSVAGDPAMRCVDGFFDCLKKQDLRVGNHAKARAQAFLASRAKTGLRLGEAAECGYWPWQKPVVPGHHSVP